MVGKVISRFFKIIIFCFVFWVLCETMYSMVGDFLYSYNIFDTDNEPAIVTEKVSKKSMTGLPKYYVIVDLNERDGFNEIKNKVFFWQFVFLDVGDTVKGHYIQGKHFFTTYDIVADSFAFVFGMVLLLFFMAALVMWPVIRFIEKREKENKQPLFKRKKKSKKQRKKIIKSLFKRVLPKKVYQFFAGLGFGEAFILIMMVGSLLFTSGFLLNGLYKLSPIGKTSTIAFVTDSDEEGGIYYYIGQYSDPYYSLDLVFTDKYNREYRVIKEVTKSVYEKYGDGGPIEISYSIFDPYNIFIHDFSIRSIFELGRYAKVYFYLTVTIIVVIFAIPIKRRKNDYQD